MSMSVRMTDESERLNVLLTRVIVCCLSRPPELRLLSLLLLVISSLVHLRQMPAGSVRRARLA